MINKRQLLFAIYFIVFFCFTFFFLPINIYACSSFLISFFVSATLLTLFILMIATNSKSWKELWNKMNNRKYWILKKMYLQLFIWFVIGCVLQINFNCRKDKELANYGHLAVAIVEKKHSLFRKIIGCSIDVSLKEGENKNQILNINIDIDKKEMQNINIYDSIIVMYSKRYPKINKMLVFKPQKTLY